MNLKLLCMVAGEVALIVSAWLTKDFIIILAAVLCGFLVYDAATIEKLP